MNAVWLHWHTEPLLIALLALGVFAILARRFMAEGERPPTLAALVFLAVAYVTVGSPLDYLGERLLLSAHMLQHMILMFALPALLLAGWPSLKRSLLAWSERRAGVLFAAWLGVMYVWHIPVLYHYSVTLKWVHITEHVSLFVTAVPVYLFLIHGAHAGRRLLLAFVMVVAMSPLFIWLAFSGTVAFQGYLYAPRVAFLPVTPLEDQVLAAMVLKGVSSGFALIAAYGAFAKLYRQSLPDRRAASSAAQSRARASSTMA